MSIARHHAEWLSLVEASGPFLSLPVLLEVFPNGLEAHEPEQMRLLKLAHEEWQDNQQGVRSDPAIHRAWVEFVLRETLGLPEEVLRSGQAIPPGLQVLFSEHQETLRPDWVVVNPNGTEAAGNPRLLVQLYPASQDLEKGLKGVRWSASPATRMMELLHACNVRLGLITNGEHWMLVNAPKGETTGYISWYATLWQEEKITLQAFRSLLGVSRWFGVDDSETLETMLTKSVNSQQEVTDQLGYQVRNAVEVLVQAIDRIDQDRHRELLKGLPETRLYEAALTVMMRLVFLFSAEERKLIPPHENEFYGTHYGVSTLRAKLREQADQSGEEILERRHDAWCRLLATFRAVHRGVDHDALFIPAYGGSLFDPDRFPFLEGRSEQTRWLETPAQPIPINNRTVLHLLEALQILQIKVPGGGVEPRKLSFRALDIEQIGHVYEGLLDHTAVRAEEPILGLEGKKNKEIPLSELERQAAKGNADLIAFLKEQTGRSPSALQKALNAPHPPTPSPTRGEGEQEAVRFPSRSGKVAGGEGLSAYQRQRLLTACNNDRALFDRVLPWAKLIRLDTFDYPVVIPAGSVYVTEGVDRRQTGTHYTPRHLTEEIVQYTLEPLVYEGVAEGQPKEAWRLRSATELLQLKICDMAMGSGAFLVQTCRYLAEKLVEAWAAEIPPHPPTPSPTGGEGEPDKWEVPEALKQKMLEVAREFRKQPTESEEILWQALRSRKLDDRKFRRQQSIGSFVVDFFCASERLIVEVDGGIHETQQDLDRQRQELLESLGLRFVRLGAQLVEMNLPQALETIRKAFAPHPLTLSPTGGEEVPPHPLIPSPTRGEGEQENGLAPLALDGRGVGGEGDKWFGSDNRIRILPDGSLAIGAVSEHILPTDLDERLLVARRIVADRCLYGVDKNPLAVEMAKLSLWLVTLAKGRPFTFLDHALKCGDSLLGITRAEQIEYLHLNPDNEAVQYPIASQIWRPILQDAIAKRRKLESFSVNGIEDLQEKERLFQEAEQAIDRLRFVGDYLIGRALADAGKTSDLTTEDLMVVSQRIEQELAGKATEEQTRDITALKASAERMLNLGNPANQPSRKPFHWLLEFPEVFLEGETKGFAAIVGNPPFLWGNRISSRLGDDYRFYLSNIHPKSHGNADLCAHFFLRAYATTQKDGCFGLIATNSISETDNRVSSLELLIGNGAAIINARSSFKWYGNASLHVSSIIFRNGSFNGSCILDEKPVHKISSFLDESVQNRSPEILISHSGLSFKGVDTGGLGFIISPDERDVAVQSFNQSKGVIKLYLNGEDFLSSPQQSPSRLIIDFSGMTYEEACQYDLLMKIVEGRVLPYRLTVKDVLSKKNWWLYNRSRPELYSTISQLNHVLINCVVAKFICFAFVNARTVFANTVNIFANDCMAWFSLLQSSLHDIWARYYGSSLETRSRYNPTDCFETFPFPTPDPSDLSTQFPILNAIGETYYTHRQAVMQTRQEGLTKTYNRFHDPNETADDIQKLRELHIEMDYAVAAAYGWHDLLPPHPLPPSPTRGEGEQEVAVSPLALDGRGAGGGGGYRGVGGEGGLGHNFHQTKQGIRFTISETARREVLDRLLELNHQRYAEEVAQGLHDKKKAKGKGQKAKGKKRAAANAVKPNEPEALQGELF